MIFCLTVLHCIFIMKIEAQDLSNISNSNPFSMSGNLGLNFSGYSVSGIESRYRPLDYNLLGNLNINIYGVLIPFTATMSEQQRSYTQPFNQFGLSPTYKWITLHGGWQSLTYSPYTLAGHTFLGGGIDLSPGIFRFSAMYGRFNKSATGDSNLTYSTSPVYERNGMAFKFGLGSNINYFDIIYLKASDKLNSLNDSLQNFVKPAENTVIGISSKFVPYHNFGVEFDAAASLYTLDTRSDEVTDSFKVDLLKSLRNIFTIRTSSQLTTAIQAAAFYKDKIFGIKLAYKRIEPDFKSMGAYYTETDVENITISPTVNLLNNSLRLGGSIGLQKDNLADNKSNTTNRLIGSLDASFQKPVYGINLKYSTYGITQSKGLNPVVDTLKISRVNHNLNLSGRYTYNTADIANTFVLNTVYQTLVDDNIKTSDNSESNNYTAVLSYQCLIVKSSLGLGLTLQAVNSKSKLIDNTFIGPSFQINKSFEKISYGGSIGYQLQNLNGKASGGVINLNLQGAYNLTKSQSLRLDCSFMNSSSGKIKESPDFSELRGNFTYNYSF